MHKVAHNNQKPSHSEIAGRAYELWVAEGRPQGSELHHWLRAETELIAQLHATTGGKKHGQKQPSQRNRYGLTLQGNKATAQSPR
jgi:hypothetical protein